MGKNKFNYKNKIKDPITCIKTDKGLITDPYITGNKFNTFFLNIASTLVFRFKTNSAFQEFLDKSQQSIFKNPTDKTEIKKLINTLASK